MRRTSKNLKRAVEAVRNMASLGALERSQAHKLTIELHQLEQALDTNNRRRIVRGLDNIARLFLRDLNSK